MSAHNNTKSYANVVKPFCKVCHDAGKTEAEYTSHFVRSEPGPKGKVVCPTLKEQECRYCFQYGHTVKFCQALTNRKKTEEKALKRKCPEEKKPIQVAKKSANAFAALDMAEDSEDEKMVSKNKITINSRMEAKKSEPKEDFPALPGASKTVKQQVAISGYANVVAKTAEEFATEMYEKQLMENAKKRMTPTIFVAPVKKSKNWADWSDSDEEEEEESYRVPTNSWTSVDVDEEW